MQFKRRLPIPQEVKSTMPLSSAAAELKVRRDGMIYDIFAGVDNRKILVIGPCSADREDAVLEYCVRLARLQDEVLGELVLIPRVYTGKPRTLGVGYKGMIHQPDPSHQEDMLEGIKAIRRIHLRVLSETGLSTADELLYPQQHRFVSDLLSYAAVGARSVENQEHRLVASGLDIPVGMKNPLSGEMASMVNAVFAAHQPQAFIYRNWEVESSGNPLAHCVLRGFESDGNSKPNFQAEDLHSLYALCEERAIGFPSVIVDCNHSNSAKRYEHQGDIAASVLEAMSSDSKLNGFVKGFMIESYLKDGSQARDEGVYGQSITDPCMGWSMTENVVRKIAASVSATKNSK